MTNTDLAERLRDLALDYPDKPYLREAADEIERLRAALRGIAVMDVYTRPGERRACDVMRDCAKAALERKP